MESLWVQVAGNAVALGIALSVIWWRLNRIEQRLDNKERDATLVHDTLWKHIREVEGRQGEILATHNVIHPEQRVEYH